MCDDVLIQSLKNGNAHGGMQYDAACKITSLRAEVESLQDQIMARNFHEMEKGIYITAQQIDAAWEMATANAPEPLWTLKEMGIVACRNCDGVGNAIPIAGGEMSIDCPRCSGHGWIREERSE